MTVLWLSDEESIIRTTQIPRTPRGARAVSCPRISRSRRYRQQLVNDRTLWAFLPLSPESLAQPSIRALVRSVKETSTGFVPFQGHFRNVLREKHGQRGGLALFFGLGLLGLTVSWGRGGVRSSRCKTASRRRVASRSLQSSDDALPILAL